MKLLTGAIGVHAVFRVGLALVSGVRNATIHPQVTVVTLLRDLSFSNKPCNERLCPGLCGHSILTKLTILQEMFKRGFNFKTVFNEDVISHLQDHTAQRPSDD